MPPEPPTAPAPSEQIEKVAQGRNSNEHVKYVVEPQGTTVVQMISPRAFFTICPFCGNTVVPIMTHEPGPMDWVICMFIVILLSPFFCIGLLFGLFFLTSGTFSTPWYVCPICGYSLGRAYIV